jgi:hypothetical protein
LSQSPVDLFKHGIKRDFNAFPTLKDEKNNDQWHHTFLNMARAQDLSDVLNPQYVSQTTAAYDLFWEKQKFLYAVLEAKVETAKGKSFGMVDQTTVFWICGVSAVGIVFTFVFSCDLTKVSLSEHDAQFELFMAGHLNDYKGLVNNPQHLSN